ncbi:MAG: class II aldolase/adducin family protein, partial [Actinomycetota bacterium]|nr:class II aldolase/adducin family protein [Actinomycetota bacterium]
YLVERADIMHFQLNGDVVDGHDERSPYLERFIHGAIFEARPAVNCVIHAHTESILPFTITDTAFVPVFHNASEIGGKTTRSARRKPRRSPPLCFETTRSGSTGSTTRLDRPNREGDKPMSDHYAPLPPFPPTRVPLPADARATNELFKYQPHLSLAERDRRRDRLRKRMLADSIDALVFVGNDIYWGQGMSNIRYIFGFDSNSGGYGLFPLEGDSTVWYALPHMNRPTSIAMSVQDWTDDIRDSGGIPAIAAELRARGLDTAKIGLVSYGSTTLTDGTLLHAEHVAIHRHLPSATLVPATSMLQDMRWVKVGGRDRHASRGRAHRTQGR